MSKEIYIPVYLIGLSIVFVVVSFLLYLTGGKNSRLLAHKLKIGALIISMTTIIGCSQSGTTKDIPPPMCYSPPPSNFVAVENEHYENNILTVDTTKDNILKARVEAPTSENFSFRITDQNDKLLQSGEIKAEDGKIDMPSESIKIEISKEIPKGKYKLYFYAMALKEVKEDELMHCSYYDLIIK